MTMKIPAKIPQILRHYVVPLAMVGITARGLLLEQRINRRSHD